MVETLIQFAVLVREVLLDATIAAVLYFVTDRLAIAPRLQARIQHPFRPLTDTTEVDANVLDYCNNESEEFAKDDCLSRARNHRIAGASWPAVLTSLQREDGVIK